MMPHKCSNCGEDNCDCGNDTSRWPCAWCLECNIAWEDEEYEYEDESYDWDEEYE